jgi:hypothetical protein
MNDDYNRHLSAVDQSFNRLEDEVHNTAYRIDSAGSLVFSGYRAIKLRIHLRGEWPTVPAWKDD